MMHSPLNARRVADSIMRPSPTAVRCAYGVDDGYETSSLASNQSELSSSSCAASRVRFSNNVEVLPEVKPKLGARGLPKTKKKLAMKGFGLGMELMEHVAKGKLELAEKKIDKGASVDFADYDKRTPLHLAACEGHVEVVKMLLRRGAKIDVVDRWGSRPYDDAVKNGYESIALLLRVGGEETLKKEHHDGLELLEYSARGMTEMVKRKIRAGTKATFADYDRRTALHLAACEGHVAIVEVLLRNGANGAFKDRFGSSAVDDALKNGMLEVLKVMEKWGCKVPELVGEAEGWMEVRRGMRLVDACARGKVGLVHKLLKEGASVNFADYDGRTPLHLACAEGHAGIVRVLLGGGGDVSKEDRWGVTPVEEAVRYGWSDVVSIMEDGVTSSPVTSGT